jgi:hypothetical protein
MHCSSEGSSCPTRHRCTEQPALHALRPITVVCLLKSLSKRRAEVYGADKPGVRRCRCFHFLSAFTFTGAFAFWVLSALRSSCGPSHTRSAVPNIDFTGGAALPVQLSRFRSSCSPNTQSACADVLPNVTSLEAPRPAEALQTRRCRLSPLTGALQCGLWLPSRRWSASDIQCVGISTAATASPQQILAVGAALTKRSLDDTTASVQTHWVMLLPASARTLGLPLLLPAQHAEVKATPAVHVSCA